MPGVNTSPNGHFWTALSFSGRPSYRTSLKEVTTTLRTDSVSASSTILAAAAATSAAVTDSRYHKYVYQREIFVVDDAGRGGWFLAAHLVCNDHDDDGGGPAPLSFRPPGITQLNTVSLAGDDYKSGRSRLVAA